MSLQGKEVSKATLGLHRELTPPQGKHGGTMRIGLHVEITMRGREGTRERNSIQKSQSRRKGNKLGPYAKKLVSMKMLPLWGTQSTGAYDKWCVHILSCSCQDAGQRVCVDLRGHALETPSAGSLTPPSRSLVLLITLFSSRNGSFLYQEELLGVVRNRMFSFVSPYFSLHISPI